MLRTTSISIDEIKKKNLRIVSKSDKKILKTNSYSQPYADSKASVTKLKLFRNVFQNWHKSNECNHDTKRKTLFHFMPKFVGGVAIVSSAYERRYMVCRNAYRFRIRMYIICRDNNCNFEKIARIQCDKIIKLIYRLIRVTQFNIYRYSVVSS